jgi:hypothetical protein
MRSLFVLFIIICLFKIQPIFGQVKLDTVILNVQVVGWIERVKLKENQVLIDRMRGLYIFPEKVLFRKKDLVISKLEARVYSMDHLFFFPSNTAYFLAKKYISQAGISQERIADFRTTSTFYPNEKHYNKKGKRHYFTITKVRVKCVKADVPTHELIQFLPWERYQYRKINPFPVYFIYDVIH